MSLIKFVTSKVFVRQIAFAIAVIVLLSFGILKWLKFSTNHGEFIEVPTLKGKNSGCCTNGAGFQN